MEFTKVVEHDVDEKIDLKRIASQFSPIPKVVIGFICIADDSEKNEDYIDEEGYRVIAIVIPYALAKEKNDIFEDLVAMVRERL